MWPKNKIKKGSWKINFKKVKVHCIFQSIGKYFPLAPLHKPVADKAKFWFTPEKNPKKGNFAQKKLEKNWKMKIKKRHFRHPMLSISLSLALYQFFLSAVWSDPISKFVRKFTHFSRVWLIHFYLLSYILTIKKGKTSYYLIPSLLCRNSINHCSFIFFFWSLLEWVLTKRTTKKNFQGPVVIV